MGLHHVSCNRESKPSTTRLSGTSLVDPVEAFEDPAEVFGSDSGPEVPHAELNRAAGADGNARVRNLAGADNDSAAWLVAGLAVLDPVFDEVAQDLQDGVVVGDNLSRGDLPDLENGL